MKATLSDRLKQLLEDNNNIDVVEALLEAKADAQAKRPANSKQFYETRVTKKKVHVIQQADIKLSTGERVTVGIADA